MRLVGYINRGRSYPAPLIAVGTERGNFFAFYPSGDKVRLNGVESVAALENRASFVPARGDRVPDLAFGIAPQLVFAGDRKSVARLLRTYLADGALLPAEEHRAIETFLMAIGEFQGKMNARELVDILSGRRHIIVKFTTRKLRRKGDLGSTLLVQLVGMRQTKTLYRKGIPRNKDLSEVQIPRPMAEYLQQQLWSDAA